MPFSHHSHSGQFCPGHAKDSLEQVVQTAISKNLKVFALTEHMPRHNVDRYPEEIEAGEDLESMFRNLGDYYVEATRLKEKYKGQVEMLIGFESDFCRGEAKGLIERCLREYKFDFYVGSLHHVHGIAVDYDREEYERARGLSRGNDERLFEDYFDEHFYMLGQLRPVVVGHFDLIRLKSDDPDGSFRGMKGVWEKILRNLDFIVSYGGILEINSAAVRKGMKEPYPNLEICQEFLARGGRFCLSDDSHGVDQVAHSYHEVLAFLEKAQINRLHYLTHSPDQVNPLDSRFPTLKINEIALSEVKQMKFWSS